MRPTNFKSVFKLLGLGVIVLLAFIWMASRVPPPAQAQGIAAPRLPLTTAYFYGPVSVTLNHVARMCSNNLFGDGSVRFIATIVNAADGRVLVGEEMTLSRGEGACLEYRPTESLDPVDILGVVWSLGGNSGDLIWTSARASGPVAALQLVDAKTRVAVVVMNTPGKVTVDSDLLPAVQ